MRLPSILTPVQALTFDVYGEPKPQGSVKGMPRRGGRGVILTSANPGLPAWRDTILQTAIAAKPDTWTTITGPTELTCTFFLPRPKNQPATIDTLPITIPDLDKLVRAVGDALTNAAVIRDDSVITDLTTRKRYAVGPHLPKIYIPGFHRQEPGVHIRVRELPRSRRPPGGKET